MALGYETTSTAPNLIANAGNAMAASIRQTGEQIRKDILSYNTDKQVAGMLSEVQNVSPDSPTFQQDLVGVLAKYPMAANDPRAKMGLQLLGNAWEQKMRAKELETQFGRQKTLAGIRYGGSGNALYGGGVAQPTDDGLGGANPMPAPASSGFSFGAGMSSLGQPQHPTGVMPDLPVSGGVVSDDAPLFNQELDGTLKRIGVDRKTGTRIMAQDAAAKAREGRKPQRPITQKVQGVGIVQWNPEERAWDTVVEEGKKGGRWVNTGTHWENVETGDQIPISMSPTQAAADADRDAGLDIRRTAADLAKSEKLANRAMKSIDGEIKTVQSDIDSVEKSIRDRQKAKDRTPAQEAELATWQEQHAALRAQRDVLQQERSEIGGVKKLDKDTVAELLKEVGGDKEKARELARSRGYSL